MQTTELKITYSDELVARCKPWGVMWTPELFKKFMGLTGCSAQNTFSREKCSVWTGPKEARTNPSGKGCQHGVFSTFKRNRGAHRLMYMMAYDIPPDLPNVRPRDPCPCGALNVKTNQPKKYDHCCKKIIRHLCKDINGNDFDGLCVNPLHMALGTFEENQHDIRRHKTGRGGVAKGDKTKWASMTNEKSQQLWEEIQQRQLEKDEGKREHIGIKELKVKYNVSRHTIVAMRRGRGWNEITGKDKEEHNQKRIDRDEQKYQYNVLKRKDPNADVPVPVKRIKLSLESAQHLLDDFAHGTSKKDLQRKYNIAETTVRDVLLGITFPTLDRSSVKVSTKTQKVEKPDGTKLCTGPCQSTKPLTEFGWKSTTKKTLQSKCIKCRSEYRKSKKQTSKSSNS